MENAMKRVERLLKLIDNEDLQKITESIDKVLPQEQSEQKEVKVKIGWAVGNEKDPGNFLSFSFMLNNKE